MTVIYDFALRQNLQENLLALACFVLILVSSLLLHTLQYTANHKEINVLLANIYYK